MTIPIPNYSVFGMQKKHTSFKTGFRHVKFSKIKTSSPSRLHSLHMFFLVVVCVCVFFEIYINTNGLYHKALDYLGVVGLYKS